MINPVWKWVWPPSRAVLSAQPPQLLLVRLELEFGASGTLLLYFTVV